MANQRLEGVAELIRLIAPGKKFTATSLLQAAQLHNSKIYTNIGSCNRLKGMYGQRNLPVRLTKTNRQVPAGWCKYVNVIEWQYKLTKRGENWLNDEAIVPVWGGGGLV